MSRTLWMLLLSAAALIGCEAKSANVDAPEEETAVAETVEISMPEKGSSAPPAATPMETATETPAAAPTGSLDGEVKLTPENTLIQFVGTHSGDKPDPRTGKFGEFSGVATLAEQNPREISVEIKTASLTTDIEKLTDHLKSVDFFNVREFPTATFKSTGIEATEPGMFKVTGDLTLLGETKSITFPAKVAGGEMTAEFMIDRTEFGMTYGDGKVEKEVAMTISVKAK
ncbi:YceI family protein [Blastopirellula retiformator]|uniref:Lipid/polyisoprenoid-binding YceI-like domain-containing protein n=1 Tax=Blastopirellula retiformator TaxID=2527970 RepID=A0A5C5VKU0_9BACT|nr:YceI family protein [Blastopirellula retiformator]TWT38540.1 hypothetical protein Enr8_02330 [Blastopirellula retiformator]